MLLRWGVFKAGFASARDPKYTVIPQKERARREGGKATTRPGERPGSSSRGA
jgi:hypothetical protein